MARVPPLGEIGRESGGEWGGRRAYMATQGQEWPAWPHGGKNGLHGHTGQVCPGQACPGLSRPCLSRPGLFTPSLSSPGLASRLSNSVCFPPHWGNRQSPHTGAIGEPPQGGGGQGPPWAPWPPKEALGTRRGALGGPQTSPDSPQTPPDPPDPSPDPPRSKVTRGIIWDVPSVCS